MNELENNQQAEQETFENEVPGDANYPLEVEQPKTDKERVQDMIDLLKVDAVKCATEAQREKLDTLKLTYGALSKEFAFQARLLELVLKRMK